MDDSLFFFISTLLLTPSYSSSSSPPTTLTRGSSLSVNNPNHVLLSSNRVFTAGFHAIGNNAYTFSIWFTNTPTVIWTANRDDPVNGKGSSLQLLEDGNLVLSDAGLNTVWTTSTSSTSFVKLTLDNTGNLVLSNSHDNILWQSFNFPTDTLLPHQPFTRYTTLISSRSQANISSGFYKLLFDNDNVLGLLYDGPEVSSIYWPEPSLRTWDAGRTTYNSTKTAVLDSYGHFKSSDSLEFKSADFGLGPKRRLTLDFDGNIRLYSLNEITRNWTVTWQAILDPCRVHGVCGPNSICTYGSGTGRGCSCIPGYKVKNHQDWSYGCELDLNVFGEELEVDFRSVRYVEFYGYEYKVFQNSTLEGCKEKCVESSICKGFLLKFEDGTYNCYAKSLILNGKESPNLLGTLYVKLNVSKQNVVYPEFESHRGSVLLHRTYKIKGENKFLNYLIWFTCALGGFEIICIIIVSFFMFLSTSKEIGARATQGYLLAATGFRKFTYTELIKASRSFKEEIGRGGGGVVYKGVLPDHRIAAIKQLNQATQGEDEFLAEVSTIGRLNHMNLIDMWGYCTEKKHRLLVCEYMQNGSLAKNLYSGALDWENRLEIAVGIAKGLAYLHDECLEWVLHCDVKPHNILLDSNYQPKIADFGLSRILNRVGYNSSFSRMRGTRGYMAPEWVLNLPISSKVDVYSYGIVVLEMVTRRGPTNDSEGKTNNGRLVGWVRENMEGSGANELGIKKIVDPNMKGQYDLEKMKVLVSVALQCVEEDSVLRPTMREVVEILLLHEDYIG